MIFPGTDMQNLHVALLLLASVPAVAIQPAPYDYGIIHTKFESVFIQAPECEPNRTEWSQMECSNFKARASKRFSKEWAARSYWDGKNVIGNPDADRRVNSEIKLK